MNRPRPSDRNLATERAEPNPGRNPEPHYREGWPAAQASGISGSGGDNDRNLPATLGILGNIIHEDPQDSDSAHDNDSDGSMQVRTASSGLSSEAETSRKIGRLSLDGQPSATPGHAMTQDRVPTANKRSATEDFSNGPRKHLTPSSRGLRGAANIRKPAARGRGSYARVSQPPSRSQGISNTGHGVYKPILPRDSGYESAKSQPPSHQNTLVLPDMSVTRNSSRPGLSHPSPPSPTSSEHPAMISQPASSPLSQQQLASEIKGIYAGLVMVEGKCINIDAAQAQANTPLGPEQWQALIALHRTLLYEHHDFMMATQHPVATDALKKLAIKYQMPARMWKHAIHAFLEVLRQRRPESHEYMLHFVYLAYQMMALLYETVTDFRDTWIECLGDLARYRMAIEDDKEVQFQWGNVASYWYTLTSDANPGTGRLNHHMGILESPSLRKLYFYTKALTSLHPFQNGHESLATFFRSLIQEAKSKHKGTAVSRVMRFHAQVYNGFSEFELKQTASEALTRLGFEHTAKLREWGVYLVISNVGLLSQWGKATDFLTQCFSNAVLAKAQSDRPSGAASQLEDVPVKQPRSLLPGTTSSPSLVSDFVYAAFNSIISLGTDRQSVRDILPSVHAILVWFYGLQTLDATTPDDDVHTKSLLAGSNKFSWARLSDCLNTLIHFDPISDQITSYARDATNFNLYEVATSPPVPEDFSLSGLLWTQPYYPAKWMPTAPEPESKVAETQETHRRRVLRVQSLALFIASKCEMLHFDEKSKQFVAPPVNDSAPPPLQALPATLSENVWRDQPASPVSHSSATWSATSDSEGWGVVIGRGKKGKKSYASSASMGRAHSSDLDRMPLDD